MAMNLPSCADLCCVVQDPWHIVLVSSDMCIATRLTGTAKHSRASVTDKPMTMPSASKSQSLQNLTFKSQCS